MVVTTMDTITSLLAGCAIFGILGNLAHEMQIENVAEVVKIGPRLAFIAIPEAMTKFAVLPQVFICKEINNCPIFTIDRRKIVLINLCYLIVFLLICRLSEMFFFVAPTFGRFHQNVKM